MPELITSTANLTSTAVYTLSDGSSFLVYRSATYGEMMITTALMAIALILIFQFTFKLARGEQ